MKKNKYALYELLKRQIPPGVDYEEACKIIAKKLRI